MRIERIDIYRVGMPLIYPFRTAYGNDDRIESILVRMAGGGQIGWGESTPWQSPGYSPECAPTAMIVVRDFLAPQLIGQDITSGVQLQDRLALVKGNPFAKAALDTAWWDLHARLLGRPLYHVLGGQKPVVDVGADFGVMESVDLLLATIGQAAEAGFKRVKLKYRPGWALDMVRAVRSAFPDLVFHVDCNSAYTLEQADELRALDAFNLAMIEQPLGHDDLIDHATLARTLRTPICLDESITSPAKARKAIAAGACGWINIKPARVGGHTPALAIHDLCQRAGVPCWVGGMLESSVGAHHCMALATLPNIRYPSDIFPSDRFYRRDLSNPPVVLSGPSQATCPAQPGCGAGPDEAELDRLTIESASLRA